jgi:hypothetical protein
VPQAPDAPPSRSQEMCHLRESPYWSGSDSNGVMLWEVREENQNRKGKATCRTVSKLGGVQIRYLTKARSDMLRGALFCKKLTR